MAKFIRACIVPEYLAIARNRFTTTSNLSLALNNLNRARQALITIENIASKAWPALLGKGTKSGAKGYPVFNAIMKDLHRVYKEAGGGG